MNKIVLIGAGSTNFGLGTIGDIFKSQFLKGSTVFLHDINSENLNTAFKKLHYQRLWNRFYINFSKHANF